MNSIADIFSDKMTDPAENFALKTYFAHRHTTLHTSRSQKITTRNSPVHSDQYDHKTILYSPNPILISICITLESMSTPAPASSHAAAVSVAGRPFERQARMRSPASKLSVRRGPSPSSSTSGCWPLHLQAGILQRLADSFLRTAGSYNFSS